MSTIGFRNQTRARSITGCATVIAAVAIINLAGCPGGTTPPPSGSLAFNNTTDPTNGSAGYVGSAACGACHPAIAASTIAHGHSQALKRVEGQPPTYPELGTRAGVPNPPAGLTWNNISYVISGYLHGAFFVDQDGFVLTNGTAGTDTQWVLEFPANGTTAGFAGYKPTQVEPLPYDYETCFRCHTTGPRPQSAENPQSQDGRPGIRGTWAEMGVMCEACHGPGSNHVPNPLARDIYVSSDAEVCGQCHTGADGPAALPAVDGFVASNTQYPQLLASGGHSGFDCTICHNPHASTTYDLDRGWRNRCTVCHGGVNLAFHENLTFTLGEYTEQLDCRSCHMPLIGRSNTSVDATVFGAEARVGDVRGHIFRINTTAADSSAFFTADGSAVQLDSEGRAAVTVDFVCLRCHNEAGGAFPLALEGALLIAQDMHAKADSSSE